MADPDYFTLVEFRALPDCSVATGAQTEFTDAEINAAAAFFTAIVEREVGVPFIPREFTLTRDGYNTAAIVLPHDHVRSISAASVNDVAVDDSLLTFGNGIVRYLAGTTWAVGVANIVITYEAGEYDTCPADVKDAVMWATRDRLITQASQNGVDVRKTSMTNDLGGTINYVLPGEKRPTGYPDLDAVIASYVRNTPSLGFA